MIRSVIIEDEEDKIVALKMILDSQKTPVEVIGEAGDLKSSLSLIQTEKPNLVFLDVSLADGNAFELLEMLDGKIDFAIIFITAYDQFAIQAIKYSALDYLMKPVDPDELEAALEKVVNKVNQEHLNEKVFNLISGYQKKSKRLLIQTQDSLEFIEVDQIVWLQAETSYTKLYMADGVVNLYSKNLKHFAELLDSYTFFRIHHSAIVNLNYVQKLLKDNVGGTALMSDGSKVPVAKRRRMEFIERIKGHLGTD